MARRRVHELHAGTPAAQIAQASCRHADGVHADTWAAGAEVFFFDVASLRGGWLYNAGSNVQHWSLGAGFAYGGFGADFAYRQSFGGATFRTLAMMIKFAVPGT